MEKVNHKVVSTVLIQITSPIFQTQTLDGISVRGSRLGWATCEIVVTPSPPDVSIRQSVFIWRSLTTVPRPIPVRPTIEKSSCIAKCSSQTSVRGLNTFTLSPVIGSTVVRFVPLYALHNKQSLCC